MSETFDVPELRDAVVAHARSMEVERVRSEASTALALALASAYIDGRCSFGLIGRTIGVSRQRVKQLVERGKLLRDANPQPERTTK